MRVLVTGGTGFVGGHAVAALSAAGHGVRVLARSPGRAAAAAALHGTCPEVTVGDMTDATAVATAVAGCDAVLHAAAEIGVAGGTGPSGDANVVGARTVLRAAADAGCDPIVSVSSVTVHVPTDEPVITTGTALAEPMSAYAASKRDIELEVRALVEEGVPVTTFVPGGVFGPRALHLDHSFSAVLGALEMLMLTPPGGCNVIDVRDLAAQLAAAVEPGRGARRYLVGGHFLTWPAWVAALAAGAGRPVASQAVSEADLLAMGRRCDELRAAGRDSLPLSEEAAVVMCAARPTDDRRALEELGVAYRPAEETFADIVAYLRASGRLAD